MNNVHAKGPVLAYGSVWMLWAAQSPASVSPESLALLRLIKPVPDLLVFGSGAAPARPPKATLQMLRSLGVALEALPTVRRCKHCFCAAQTSYNQIHMLPICGNADARMMKAP